MKTFYFNTGVKYSDYPTLYGAAVVRNGVKVIPFDVDDSVPDNAVLMSMCDNPELPESKLQNVIVVPVFNTDMISKFAYFKIKGE
jgi:hypothetical protein